MATKKQDLDFNKNEDGMKQLISQMKRRLEKVYLGGGQKRINKQHASGKMTARERVIALLDHDKPQIEIGAFAGEGMYAEYGGCPSGGVVVYLGYVQSKICIVVANDATVKAGAWFPITGKKNLRAQEIAMDNYIPIIYLVDSAGVFLPMQDEIFPDKEHFGRIFRNNAVMSSKGINQISAIMGSCVAGGAYLPIMSDEAMIVEGTGSIFLAGSYLVKAAIGEDVANETLGGATIHCEISGVTDYKCKDDADAIGRIQSIMDKTGGKLRVPFDRKESKKPKLDPKDIYGIFNTKTYETRDIIKRLVDDSDFEEYKELYGQSIVTGYARIDGWAVGIVANQRNLVKSKTGEMKFGGVIYSDSADKAARFIMNCNQKNIPLVFLQDVTGFMVGSRSEQGGIIKDGAKMVNAMSNSVVPKFTFIMGNSYGAGNYAMCGKAYDPRLIYSWPTANLAVMSGKSAANTLLQIEVASLKSKGEEITDEKKKELLDRITKRYEEQTSPYYAAARLWVDGIIDPLDTRMIISTGIDMASHEQNVRPYNVGVIQT